MNLKRLLSIVLTLAMVFSLLPQFTLPAVASGTQRTTTLDLTSTAYQSESGVTYSGTVYTNAAEGWSYDTSTLTLTLSGVNINTNATSSNANGINLPAGATITLDSGTTNIVRSGNTTDAKNHGINSVGSLTIDGTGSLESVGGSSSSYSRGIYAEGDLTIKGGNITATGGKADYSYGICSYNQSEAVKLDISAGSITAIGGEATYYSYGIYGHGAGASTFAISGGEVEATGGKTDYYSYGIYVEGASTSASTFAISGGEVKATGGEAGSSSGIYALKTNTFTISGENTVVDAQGGAGTGTSYGIFLDRTDTTTVSADMNISGKAVTATGGVVSTGHSYGIYASIKYGTADIDISAKSLTATGGTAANGNSYGICALVQYGTANIVISDGTLSATGGTAKNSYGIDLLSTNAGNYTDTLTISGANTVVTATGGAASGASAKSYGITTWGTITVSGGTVTANGGTGVQSCGINAFNTVTLSGANTVVETTGGTASSSNGIYLNKPSGTANINISAKTVTATGGTATNGSSFGISAYIPDGTANIAISDGSITATGGAATNSYGIYSNSLSGSTYTDTLDISGANTVVTATGGTATTNSYGIYVLGINTISGGTGTASITETASAAKGAFNTTPTFSNGIVFLNGTYNSQTVAWGLPVQVTGVTLNKNTTSLSVSGTETLTPTVAPSNATTKTVTWSSSDAAVATVANGVITAVSAGSATITVTTTDGSHTATCEVTVTSNNNGGGGGGYTPPTNNNVPVIVDGKEINIGTQTTKGSETTVTVNQTELNKQIASASDHVIIPVTGNTTTATAQLVAQNVVDMAAKNMTLEVKSGNIRYSLPTTAVNIAEIKEIFGEGANLANAPISISISKTDDTKKAAVEVTATEQGFALVVPPVDFTITATYEGKTAVIDSFLYYVTRDIELTAEQAKKTTTAVVHEADGTVRHVPTNVYQKDGKHYAKVNSMTNSTYALIYNEASFDDTLGKWYAEPVSEMASRKIISGVGGNMYAGERDITRAEFAAIIVRALGLPTDGISTFSDVASTAWYSGAVETAAKYGIVGGVGDNKFAPDAKITRQEAMAMVARAANVARYSGEGGRVGIFSDYDTVSAWAKTLVDFNLANGIIVGSGGLVRPQDDITRAETAVIILRLLQKAGLVDVRSKA